MRPAREDSPTWSWAPDRCDAASLGDTRPRGCDMGSRWVTIGVAAAVFVASGRHAGAQTEFVNSVLARLRGDSVQAVKLKDAIAALNPSPLYCNPSAREKLRQSLDALKFEVDVLKDE